MAPPRRRRNQNRFLDNVGRISPGTLAMFGIAMLLLFASAGIVATTVVRRSSASTAEAPPTPETTPFVAIVETPFPTPITLTVTTPRASASPRTAASPATPTTGSARTATATVSPAAVGSGQSKAARGLAGAMAAAVGGSLPPAQTGAAAPPTGPIVVPPSLPTPTPIVQPTSTPTRVTGGGTTGGGTTGGGTTGGTTGGGTTGGGTTGGGTTGGGTTGGGTTAPTATRTSTPLPTATNAPLPTATRPVPTATATATPTLPPVAFPGPGSALHSYAFAYTLGTNISDADTSASYYIIQWQAINQQQFAAIATGAGIDGAVQVTADGFRATGGAGTLVYNNTTKQVIFTASGAGAALVQATPTLATPQASGTPKADPALAATATVPAASAAPSAAPTATIPPTTVPTVAPTPTTVQPIGKSAALGQAQEWLARANLLPDGHDGGTVTQPGPDLYVVTFNPKPDVVGGKDILGDPAVVVKLSGTGAVREVSYRWFTNPNPRITALRGGEAAWGDVAAGKAYLEVDQTVPTGSTTVYRGSATVTDVAIELRAETAANGTTYLIPVYVFKGTVVISNPVLGQSGQIPFRLYVRALP